MPDRLLKAGDSIALLAVGLTWRLKASGERGLISWIGKTRLDILLL
jgi:uncharacterized membrane protein